jgi:hypothetical protein
MSLIVQDGGLGTTDLKNKEKLEGGKAESSWTEPLYGIPPELIFDKNSPISQMHFFEKYALSNFGLSPKKIRIGRELEEAEVEALFLDLAYKVNEKHISFYKSSSNKAYVITLIPTHEIAHFTSQMF